MKRFQRYFFLIFLVVMTASLFAQTTVIEYMPSDAIFPNPERGFYAHREVQAEGSALSLSDLRFQRSQNRTLVFRIYYLKSFRDKALSQAQLDLIQQDFNTMRTAGVKCALRFAYSQGIGQPDAPLAIIRQHLDQLQPLLEANKDVIAVMQAGFIGAWGEWHSSTHGLANTAGMRAVLFKILQVLPDRMVQVRTPRYKQNIFLEIPPLPPSEAFSGSDIARTGHHNDCFLASWDDFGTYTDTLREKNYLNQEDRYVPMGGETCNPSAFSGCNNALKEMARMHWSYLNRDYHPTVLNGFITGGCMDEIKRRLGYRFSLIKTEHSQAVKPGSGFAVSIELTNSGWASPFNPRDVEILLRNTSDSAIYFAKLPDDPRFWQSGDTVIVDAEIGVPVSMPEGDYTVLLNLPDPEPSIHQRPEYAIHLTNPDVWEPQTGYNNLLTEMTVDAQASGDPFNDSLLFQPLEPVTAIITDPPIVPMQIRLSQNYPNPFNPTTTIEFFLPAVLGPQAALTTLKIYNIVGKEVATLVSERLSAGNHRYRWDAGKLPSGVYFYKLETGKYALVKKALFLK